MKIYDIINETIPRPPRNLILFMKNRNKELQALLILAQQIKALELNSEAISDLGYVAKDVISHDEAINAVDGIEYFTRYTPHEFESLRQNMEYILSLLEQTIEENPMVADYLYKAIQFYVESIERLESEDRVNYGDMLKLAQSLPQLSQTMEEQDYFNIKYLEPYEIENNRKALKAVEMAGQLASLLIRVKTSKNKLADVGAWRLAHAFGAKPKPEEIETLYHATAFADELEEEGWKAERPETRRGLGSFGTFKNPSFTHDIHYARVIARALKELVMIANGDLRKHTLLRWLQEDGIDRDKIVSSVGKDIVNEPESIENNARLFNAYLWFNNIGRENPVFTHITDTVQRLKGKEPKDVGIIQARVRTTHPEVEYKASEKEWMIPVSEIESFKRVQ